MSLWQLPEKGGNCRNRAKWDVIKNCFLERSRIWSAYGVIAKFCKRKLSSWAKPLPNMHETLESRDVKRKHATRKWLSWFSYSVRDDFRKLEEISDTLYWILIYPLDVCTKPWVLLAGKGIPGIWRLMGGNQAVRFMHLSCFRDPDLILFLSWVPRCH